MKKKITCLFLFTIVNSLYSQNVGLGVASPTRAKLEVNGVVGNTTAIFGGDGTGVGLIGSWPEVGYNAYYNGFPRYIANGYCAVQVFDPGSGSFGFDVHGSGVADAVAQGPATRRAMTILNNGRMMLGLSSGSDATLNVGWWASTGSTAYFGGSTFNYSSTEYTVIRRKNISEPMYINNTAANSKVVFGNGSGLVGINWGTPVYPLEIHSPDLGIALMRTGSENNWLLGESQVYFKLFFRTATVGNPFPTIEQKGSFNYNTGVYSPSSDERLKQNIISLEPMLGKLMQLRPTEYEMIANNKGHYKSIGLIAQEVKELFPELVHVRSGEHSGYTDLKDLYLLNYSSLAPVVIKSLQEQQSMLNELEKKLVNMESQTQGRQTSTKKTN